MPNMMFQTLISRFFKLVLVLATFILSVRRLVACSSRRIRNTLPNAIASFEVYNKKCKDVVLVHY